MVYRVLLALVTIPATHPLLSELIFEVGDVVITVDMRFYFYGRFGTILFWVGFVAKRDNVRIWLIRWKDEYGRYFHF